ncbi:MAG TPA: MFS transporter [Jatrophihabitantaceae bacterium]|nr:MFS transporter [Jatrophihabitantaceae bacterium]
MTTTNLATVHQRRALLAVCCTALMLATMDATIVNIALPDIGSRLHAPLSGLQWTVDAYSLVLATLFVAAGSLGDRFGRRRIFRIGLTLFVLGSLLCSAAPGLGWLIGFRVVQAVGGSMLNPVAMSIVVNEFREPAERAKAIGVWGGVAGLSMALGPIVGGLLVSASGWRSIFWINVPIALIALALTGRYVPESRAPHVRALDPRGQVLVVLTLGAAVYAIIEAPRHGWGSPVTIGTLALAAVALLALLAAESRRAEPLIEVRFFRSVPFSAATVTAVAAAGALSCFLFVNTLYLQLVLGCSPVEAGLRTLPMAAVAGLCAPFAGRLVAARGARLPLVLSGCATAAGGALLISLSAHTPWLLLSVAYALIGVGFGLVNPPITNTATSGMPRAQAGVAAALTSASRQVGMSLGVAVSGPFLAGASAAQFSAASRPVWLIVAGCGVCVTALGGLATSRQALARAAVQRVRWDGQNAERELARSGQP